MHTTFTRFRHAKKTIESFRFLPDIFTLYIADTGPITPEKIEYYGDVKGTFNGKDNKVHMFGWDVSPAITRNYLIDSVEEDYILKIDDDFQYQFKDFPDGAWETIQRCMDVHDIDLMGFGVYSDKYESEFIYDIDYKKGEYMRRIKLNGHKREHKNMKYQKCDITPDCWLAKREIFPDCNYDENYHVGEGLHTDFFAHIALNTDYTIAYTPTFRMYTFKHSEGWEMSKEERKKSYYYKKRFRDGLPPKMKYFKSKWDIKELIT